MYENEYESYIRSILGYPLNYNNYINYNNQSEETIKYNDSFKNNLELEKYYPEIYKLIYPMILKKCNECIEIRKNIDREEIEKMTNEIYYAIEDKEIKIDTNPKNRINQNQMVNRQMGETREYKEKNNTLRDLIKILLIKELINHLQKPNRIPPYIPPRPPIMGTIPPMPPFRP